MVNLRQATLFVLIVGIASVLCTTAFAQSVLFEDDFEGSETELDGTGGWVSHYCDDAWIRYNGQAAAATDGNYCGGNECCSFGADEECDDEPIDGAITNGNATWTDYTLAATFLHEDNDTIGVVFRYQDAANYYLFFMSNDRAPGADGCNFYTDYEPYSALYRIVEGSGEMLFESTASYVEGVDGGVQITVAGTAITIAMDNNADDVYTVIFEGDDVGSPLTSGAVGLYAYGSGWPNCGEHCGFKGITVTSPLDPDGDVDDDDVSNKDDNCPTVSNSNQADHDNDGIGDACEADTDEDGIIDDNDNCPNVPNNAQDDHDDDDVGDACELDSDDDGKIDDLDNCPQDYNPEQEDSDGDNVGDACDPDSQAPNDSCAAADLCCEGEAEGCSPNGGDCFCDDACLVFDDCCEDYEDYCMEDEEGGETTEEEGGGTSYDCLVDNCDAGACPNFDPCDGAMKCMAECEDIGCAEACAADGPGPAQGLLLELALCGLEAGCFDAEEEGGETTEEEGGETTEEEGGETLEEEGGEVTEEGGESGTGSPSGTGLTIEAGKGDRGCQSTDTHGTTASLFLLLAALLIGRRLTRQRDSLILF